LDEGWLDDITSRINFAISKKFYNQFGSDADVAFKVNIYNGKRGH